MPKKLEPGFFPPSDASQAMSNWVEKPDVWLKSLGESKNGVVKLVCSYQNPIRRVAIATLALLAAPMDCFYNIVWFSIKLVVVSSRGVVRVLTVNKFGYYAEKVTSQDLKDHLYKSTAYFCAIFSAPVVGLVAPDKLLRIYCKRELIYREKEKSRLQAMLDAVQSSGEFVLERVKDGKEYIFKQVQSGKEFVLQHPIEVAAGGVVTLTALGGAGVTLQQILQ